MLPWGLLIQLGSAAISAIPKIQALFGPTKDEAHGDQKASAAMDLVKQAVPELEDIFQVSPQWRAVVEAGISLAYEALKASGRLEQMTAVAAGQVTVSGTTATATRLPDQVS